MNDATLRYDTIVIGGESEDAKYIVKQILARSQTTRMAPITVRPHSLPVAQIAKGFSFPKSASPFLLSHQTAPTAYSSAIQ